MNLFHILFLQILAITGVRGQDIQFELPSHSASCQDGYRGDIDEYLITGTVGPNYHPGGSDWDRYLTIQVIDVGATEFKPICLINFGKGGVNCNIPTEDACYCDQLFNATTGSAHFIVKSKARVRHSNRPVRWVLQRSNGSNLYSDADKMLPGIYDEYTTELTLYVNGDPAKETSESCGSSFKANAENTIKLCCSKAALPCYPRIAFDGIIVAENQSNCVSYTFTAKNETFNVTKSYLSCNSTDYKPHSTCIIKSSFEITTVAPTKPSTKSGFVIRTVAPTKPSTKSGRPIDSTHTTVGPTSSSSSVTVPNNEVTDHGLDVGLVLDLGIAFIVASSIIIFFYVKCCKKNSAAVDSTGDKDKQNEAGLFPANNEPITSAEIKTILMETGSTVDATTMTDIRTIGTSVD